MKKFRLLITFLILNSIFQIANAQWVPDGLGTPQTLCFTSSGSNIFAGTYNGMSISANNGASWTSVNNGLPLDSSDFDGVYVLVASGANIFAGTSGQGVYLSNNKGSDWTAINNGLFDGDDAVIGSLAVSGTTLFAGLSTGYVYLSNDSGKSWSSVSSGLPTFNEVTSLLVDGSNMIAGTENVGIYLNSNDSNWTPVNNDTLLGSGITSIVISGSNIFAAVNFSSLDTALLFGVYLSTDNGITWTAVSNGLPGFTISALAVIGTNVFAATLGAGVYFSPNNGASWTAINDGLPIPYISTIAICGPNIFAGVGGVYQRRLSDFGINTPLLVSQGVMPMLCTGSDVGTIIDTVLGGIPPYTIYATKNGTNYSYSGEFDTTQFAYGLVGTITGLDSGIYAVTIRDSVNDSIMVMATVAESLPWSIVLSLSGDTVCGVQTVSANCSVSGGAPPYNFSWTEDSINFIYGVEDSSVNGLRAGHLTIIIADSIGCVATADTAIYACASGVGCSAQFSLYPDTSAANTYYALNRSFGNGPLTYLWNWGDDSTSTGPTPSHTYADSGYYTICLTIIDSTGCTGIYCDSSAYLRSGHNLMVTVDAVTSLPTGTGIPVVENGSTVSIYPNPSAGLWQLEVSGDLLGSAAEIYDDEGRIVFNSKLKTQNSKLELNIPAGVYYLRISNAGGSVVRKLVKM